LLCSDIHRLRLLVAGFARSKTSRASMRAGSSRDILLATRFPHPISE
jgi:hypothetical protein